MKVINVNTKIGYLIKQNPKALDAITSISPKFNKLKNPLLRKLMAPRTSISMASKIGGCSVDDFFDKLEPLGFEVDRKAKLNESENASNIPEFMQNLSPDNTLELDVRAMLDAGEDPLNLIREKVRDMAANQVLKLINSFEPIPLIQLLEKQGYESYCNIEGEDLVYTYFHKGNKVKETQTNSQSGNEDWDAILSKFEGKLKEVNVRHLEMPMPMLTILDELDKLPEGQALFVFHKRIPVFLLPELQERNFDYRIKEISDGDVNLLIFKA